LPFPKHFFSFGDVNGRHLSEVAFFIGRGPEATVFFFFFPTVKHHSYWAFRSHRYSSPSFFSISPHFLILSIFKDLFSDCLPFVDALTPPGFSIYFYFVFGYPTLAMQFRNHPAFNAGSGCLTFGQRSVVFKQYFFLFLRDTSPRTDDPFLPLWVLLRTWLKPPVQLLHSPPMASFFSEIGWLSFGVPPLLSAGMVLAANWTIGLFLQFPFFMKFPPFFTHPVIRFAHKVPPVPFPFSGAVFFDGKWRSFSVMLSFGLAILCGLVNFFTISSPFSNWTLFMIIPFSPRPTLAGVGDNPFSGKNDPFSLF